MPKEYDNFRPGIEDLQKDDVQRQLKEIESARNAALQQKRGRPTKPFGPAPKPETGLQGAYFRSKSTACWKSQSKGDYRQVKVWMKAKSFGDQKT